MPDIESDMDQNQTEVLYKEVLLRSEDAETLRDVEDMLSIIEPVLEDDLEDLEIP